MPVYTSLMLAAGVGVPILAALNAALGREIGSPAVAASVAFTVALCVALIVAAATGFEGTAKLRLAPKHFFLAGGLIAFYLLSITYVAPHFGIGNAIFFVLVGQLVSAAVIDHFGLFGAVERSMTVTRAGGLALMIAGVFLTQRA